MWSRSARGTNSPKPGYADSGGTTMRRGSSAVTRLGTPSAKLSAARRPASARAVSAALAACPGNQNQSGFLTDLQPICNRNHVGKAHKLHRYVMQPSPICSMRSEHDAEASMSG
jgi:hypothetical protein